MAFSFFKKKPAGKNQELNTRLAVMRGDMANNYKDAAQTDFRKAVEIYERLLAEGKLSEKEKAYYDEEIASARKELVHFTHFEGPGTGRYDSGTSDGLLKLGNFNNDK